LGLGSTSGRANAPDGLHNVEGLSSGCAHRTQQQPKGTSSLPRLDCVAVNPWLFKLSKVV